MYITNDKTDPRFAALTRTLIDLGSQQGYAPDTLLSGSKVFVEDLIPSDAALSAQQFLKTVGNCLRQKTAEDLLLQSGRRWSNLCPPQLRELLAQAGNLHEACELLCHFDLQFLPLRHIHFVCPENTRKPAYLVFSDALGCGHSSNAVSLACMAAVTQTLKNLQQDTDNWVFHNRDSAPQSAAYLHTFLGPKLQFDSPLCAIAIPQYQLADKVSSQQSPLARQHALQQCETLRNTYCPSFISYCKSRINRDISSPQASLDLLAQRLQTSPASLKRRLKQHNSSYQQLLNEIRAMLALYYIHIEDCTNEQAAARLCFHDSTNFRRAFKQWTGMRPSELRLV
jgi:AraC-like DNA-binding protein